MDEKELNKKYRSIIRSHARSGAEWQQVSERKCGPVGETSPYWDYARKSRRNVNRSGEHEVVESSFSSGDGRAFQQTGDIQSIMRDEDITKEVQGRVRKLLELSKQILTEQQYHVFILMAVKEPHLTVRETAKVLSLSTSRVGQLWQAARKKLEKAYDTRTA